jgi:hypothetical protein
MDQQNSESGGDDSVVDDAQWNHRFSGAVGGLDSSGSPWNGDVDAKNAEQTSFSLNTRLSELFDPIARIGLPISVVDSSVNAPPSPAPGSGGRRDQLCR